MYGIPRGIETIAENAFCQCQYLQGVFIPSSVMAIGEGAFYGCGSLKEIALPSGLSAIGPKAFAGCRSLKEFRMEGTNPSYSLLGGVLYAAFIYEQIIV
jgi:hypothetical protein